MLNFPVFTPPTITDYCYNSSFLYIGLKHSVGATFPFTVKTSLQYLHNSMSEQTFMYSWRKKTLTLTQNKVLQTTNDVPTTLIICGLFKIYCIIKLHTCLFFFDSINHIKSSNFTFPLISEQRDYCTRSSSTKLLQIPPSNQCPKILSCCY